MRVACSASLRAMFSVALLALAAALSSGTATAAAEPGRLWRVTLEAPEELRPLLEENLDLFRLGDRTGLDDEFVEHLAARSAGEVRDLLATAGHFRPEIFIDARRENGVLVVHLRVEPGPQAVVTTTDIRIGGAIETAAGDAARAGQGRITAGGNAELGGGLRQLELQARAERAQILNAPQ